MNAIELIEQQQKKLEKNSAAWVVGEQLKDICRSEPASAALLAEDMGKDGMTLADAEKQVRAYADTHRHGNFAFVPPKVAEDILRKFYGLPDGPDGKEEQPKQESSGAGNIIDLMDLL